MASATYVQFRADGTRQLMRRKKQGRRSQGLSAPVLVRLHDADAEKIKQLAAALGTYWNTNEFIRQAVREKLSNSVYTELVNP